MAKLADVFGRLEAFSLSVILYVLGYIQMATSTNVQTFASAQIFYSAGGTGLQILQQVFIADTSDLLNRALWSSLPDIPFLITVWIGSIIGNSILKTTTWRWGYGMWTIILPVMFLPLALTLFLSHRKAKKAGLKSSSPWKNANFGTMIKNVWFKLDTGGIILLSAAFALILIPLTVASKTNDGWTSRSIIVMLVIGFICLFVFPLWESSKKLSPHPLIPPDLLKSNTFCAGCGIGFFYFSLFYFVSHLLRTKIQGANHSPVTFYLSVQPYFYSYLLVVHQQSVTAAGHITQTFSFTATVASVLISLVIKHTKHYKYFIVSGSLIYLVGIGLMILYRSQGASIWRIIGTQIAVGIGGGVVNVSAQLGVQASTDHSNVAVATAVYLTCVEIGGAVGSAISGAVWGKKIPDKLEQYLPTSSKQNAAAIYDSITNALAYEVGTPDRIAIDRAYQETMKLLLIIAVCVAAPLVPLSLLMRNYKLDQMDQHVKGRVIGGTVQGQRDEVEMKSIDDSPA